MLYRSSFERVIHVFGASASDDHALERWPVQQPLRHCHKGPVSA